MLFSLQSSATADSFGCAIVALKKNMLHERFLRVIYNDKQSSFTELLKKDNSVSIHIRSIQRLAIEMVRFYNGLLPQLIFPKWCLHLYVT